MHGWSLHSEHAVQMLLVQRVSLGQRQTKGRQRLQVLYDVCQGLVLRSV